MKGFFNGFENMADLTVYMELIDILSDTDENDTNFCLLETSMNQQHFFKTAAVVAGSTLRHQKHRIISYVETVLPKYTIDDFKDRFRIDRVTFDMLLAELKPFIDKKKAQRITVEKKLLLFIRYLSTQLTFKDLADMFGVCESSVYNIVHQLSQLVNTTLLTKLIKWPTGERVRKTVDGFARLSGFPGVIGTIDGSHIAIRTPSNFQENYINRKSFHSVVLQAVCDSSLMFTDVFCGWPGSVHDARILKNSPLAERINQNCEDVFPNNTHLLGDAAYGCETWMMVPYKNFGNLNNGQKTFNYLHSSTRMCIERAFGALKGRFRRLKFIDLEDITCIVDIVLSCCVLHQLCIASEENIDCYVDEGMTENEEVNDFVYFYRTSSVAENKRNSIMSLMQ